MPRRLVGSEGRFGAVPARLSPVFRDREDLSSAADLTTSVKQELAASETLVVICSPAAAASRWVNEEVRYFRELGRGDHILALIVDGDPKASDPKDLCFPPALLEGADGAPFEPLAADARKWADGKALARLKLVAGILGIRLDDLRQRDMQRKHRLWVASAAGAMTIAIVTSVLAVLAITARNQAENRREQAENLVGYMVGDLQDNLSEVGRLDILQGMGGEVAKYLQTLDKGEVTDTSLKQQALVWRHLGTASQSQGDLEEAMAQFSASLAVLSELYRRDPTDVERIYEMAQAEFWVGYVHLERGRFEEASASLNRYLEYANRLAELEPDNPEWLLEQSMAHGNIAALLYRQDSFEVERALEEINASVELNRRVLEMEPDNPDYVSEYGEALAWQADLQLLLCDLGGALNTRLENLRIARQSLDRSPANVSLRRRYAYALSGLANVAKEVGLSEYAATNIAESVEVLGDIYLADTSNLDLRWDQLTKEGYLAVLQAESGSPGFALESLDRLYRTMEEILQSGEKANQRRREDWVRYLLHYADVAWLAGQSDKAERLWAQATEQMARWIEEGSELQPWRGEIIFARFIRWHHQGGTDQAQGTPDPMPDVQLSPERPYISCEDRSLLVLQALFENRPQEARVHAQYLLDKGYFEPGFLRICRHYDLCQGYG